MFILKVLLRRVIPHVSCFKIAYDDFFSCFKKYFTVRKVYLNLFKAAYWAYRIIIKLNVSDVLALSADASLTLWVNCPYMSFRVPLLRSSLWRGESIYNDREWQEKTEKLKTSTSLFGIIMLPIALVACLAVPHVKQWPLIWKTKLKRLVYVPCYKTCVYQWHCSLYVPITAFWLL